MRSNQHKTIIDPTPTQEYLRRKAERLGVKINEPIPDTKNNDSNWKKLFGNLNGWTKSLQNLPAISNTEIDAFITNSVKSVTDVYTEIKKIKTRGLKFFEEKHIDSDTFFTKQNDEVFLIKGKCSASKKQIEYNQYLVLSKTTKEIIFAYCECKAGEGGLCSHSYASMKTSSMWSVKGLVVIPTELSCTEKPCQWSQRKISAHTDQRVPVFAVPVPPKKYAKKEVATNSNSSLYEAGVRKNTDLAKLETFKSKMKNTPLSYMLNAGPVVRNVTTKFGDAPIGSPLSYQYPIMDLDYKVKCSFDVKPMPNPPIIDYPTFPINMFTFLPLRNYTDQLDDTAKKFIAEMYIDYKMSENIEKDTRAQASSDDWHNLRAKRFTASKFYEFKGINKPKGFSLFAERLVAPKEPNKFLEKIFEYGRVNESVALEKYEQYFKTKNHPLHVESSGLVIQPNSYILGASPDGKVIDVTENSMFGLVEIKCPYQYADFDIADIALVQSKFCLKLDDIEKRIKINKEHAYYDQVQMQMALTGTKWCDFVVYGKKGMVIDRVYFDQLYWNELQKKIYDFYFTYFLPLLLTSN